VTTTSCWIGVAMFTDPVDHTIEPVPKSGGPWCVSSQRQKVKRLPADQSV
jgi:hypothetical protein